MLSNGLTLLAQRRSAAPVVAVVTHVRAGYFDEPDEWVGIAHVLEHMYFKGTARRPPGSIARETQRLGGYINAATSYDHTVYYTVLPSASGGLARALDIQADALMHAAIDPDELRREIEVVVHEARRKKDSPGAVAVETLYAALYRVHRIRRWRIGTEDGLRRLTREDVRAYYETRYTPDRVIVALVGDVDPERAIGEAAKVYESWDRPPAVVPGSPAEPPFARAETRCLRGDVERPLAVVGWRTVGTLHPDAPALDVAADLLGTGRGARLYWRVRAPGLAAAVGADHYSPTEVGVFSISLEADASRFEAALAAAWEVAVGLADHEPRASELERVRSLVATRWAHRFEQAESRAAALCAAEALGDYRLVDELYRRVRSVTPEAVCDVARRYLSPAQASAVAYVPAECTTPVFEAWPPAVAARPHVAAEPQVPSVPAASFGSGRVVDHPWDVFGLHDGRCDVLVREHRGSGLVTLGIHFSGAPRAETPQLAGVSWLLARAAVRGAGPYDAEALAILSERLGGSIAPAVSRDALGWWLTVPAAAARAAAGVLRHVAFEAHLAADHVAVEASVQASDARRIRDDMFRHPVQQVLAQAFFPHAYGLPPLGDPEQVEEIGGVRVRDWARRLRSLRPVVVAVGDLPREELLAAVEPLGEWPAGDGETGAGGDAAPPAWQAQRAAETRDKEQTALAVAFPAPASSEPARYPLMVLASLLSGMSGRLFEELRERRSLAYTVTAFPWFARSAGSFMVYVATAPEREDEVRDALGTEFGGLQTRPPTGDELERARGYAAGSVEIGLQTTRALASEILDAWVCGTMEDLGSVPRRLRAVAGGDLLSVAEQVLQADRRAEYVVRGRRGG